MRIKKLTTNQLRLGKLLTVWSEATVTRCYVLVDIGYSGAELAANGFPRASIQQQNANRIDTHSACHCDSMSSQFALRFCSEPQSPQPAMPQFGGSMRLSSFTGATITEKYT
eukprot:4749532-Pleurochrysis_carterae.AAC.1